MDTEEHVSIKTMPVPREVSPSSNPLIRNKGTGSPIVKSIDPLGDASQGLPTVRLGKQLMLTSKQYKKSRNSNINLFI